MRLTTYTKTMCFVWWLAIIAPSGETIFMEWRHYDECKFMERIYKRVSGLKVTTCTERISKTEVG